MNDKKDNVISNDVCNVTLRFFKQYQVFQHAEKFKFGTRNSGGVLTVK